MTIGVLVAVFFVVTAVGLLLWVYRHAAPLGKFGDYELIKIIGQGGMATIYKARHPVRKKTVALKVMDNNLLKDRDLVLKFFMEGEAIENINNAFPQSPVVKVIEYGAKRYKPYDIPFIAMEYLKGKNLTQLIRKNKISGLRQKLFIVKEIARALKASHQLRIIHRDVSPDNVIISSSKITLFDFGIAKQELNLYKTLDGSIAGKPIYMSPEQCAGKKVTDKSDIYSLGVIFYYLVEGQPPFYDKNPVEIMNKHKKKLPPAFTRDVPPAVKNLISAMLAKSPQNRPSADDIIDILDNELKNFPSPASRADQESKTAKIPLAKIHFTEGPLKEKDYFIYNLEHPDNPAGHVTLGRQKQQDSDSNFVLIPSLTVSRLQAKIEYKNDRLVLTNYSETNYTRVNGKEILPQKSILISQQDNIQMGDSTCKVERIESQT
jgi:serine/threonine-protein kinase